MPQREPRALLEDALSQIDDLRAKVKGASLEALLRDRDMQAVFERRFEILGEAMRRLERSAPDVFARVTGSREAVDMRNFISHGYDGVDHRVRWSAAIEQLPMMRESIVREINRR